MADNIKVLAGDWRKATFTGAGFKLSNGAFSAPDTRAWTDITDLTIASQDAGSRGGETAFTATFTDGKLLFAATSSSTFHKIQTALTAHRIALQRSGLPPAQSRNWGCLFAVGCVVALPVMLIISSIINPSPPGPSALHAPQTTHVDRPTSQDDELLAMHIVQDAEQAVRDNLKDPDSAQFQGVAIRKGTATVCGLVNAKNGFGGYSGYVEFFSIGGQKAYTEVRSGPQDREFVKAYNRPCTK